MKSNTFIPISTRSFSRPILAFACLLAQIVALSVYAAQTNENRGSLSASDYRFACAAARGGMTEVETGKVAAQKATDPAIQQFGQKMVTDHGKAGDQLKQILAQKGATCPMDMTAGQQKQLDHLNSLSGTDFDKEYESMMVKDHKMDAKEFEKASKNAEDADLKSFAANTLPVVQEHLRMIEALKSGNKVASTNDMMK